MAEPSRGLRACLAAPNHSFLSFLFVVMIWPPSHPVQSDSMYLRIQSKQSGPIHFPPDIQNRNKFQKAAISHCHGHRVVTTKLPEVISHIYFLLSLWVRV